MPHTQPPSSRQRIGCFGGTFDPVHLGHIHLASLAQASLQLDEVRFLPCEISPHKSTTPPTSGTARCEMLRLATADLPWAVVDDYELRHSGPSYSYLTAEAIAAQFPTAELFWILGGDQWAALPKWQHPERLAAQVQFIVLARGEEISPREGFRLHTIQGQHPASATAIRTAISHGETPQKWLTPSVAQWISQHGIYSTVAPF